MRRWGGWPVERMTSEASRSRAIARAPARSAAVRSRGDGDGDGDGFGDGFGDGDGDGFGDGDGDGFGDGFAAAAGAPLRTWSFRPAAPRSIVATYVVPSIAIGTIKGPSPSAWPATYVAANSSRRWASIAGIAIGSGCPRRRTLGTLPASSPMPSASR